MNRTARRLFSALEAMLRVLSRGMQFTSVDGLMTGDANSDSVCNVNNSFGMLGNRFNMMGVEIPAVPALLTFKAVPLKNRRAPFGKVAFGSGSLSIEAMPALPSARLFTYTGTASALARAKHSRLVFGCKLLFAPSTMFFNRGIPMRPTFFTAISGSWGAICFDFIFRSANLTRLYLLGIFHGFIMPCNKNKCKPFIVRMHDAFPDLEIRRIE